MAWGSRSCWRPLCSLIAAIRSALGREGREQVRTGLSCPKWKRFLGSCGNRAAGVPAPAGWSWLRLASMEPRGKDVSEATACVPLTSPCPPPTSRIQKLPHQVPLCHKIFYWEKKNHRLRKRGVGAPATSVCLGAISGHGGLRRAAGSPTRGSACVPGGVWARRPARGEWGVQERSGA